MSTTIDEKVVEMRFDNKQFESNVATSMSTLEKLKQKLNLSGASKGLEEIDAAAKRVDMSSLGGAVESVRAKFSALDVIAVTALANITNSAINTGKNLLKSLSIDQLSAGWQKFSDKTTSVATLVAQGNAIEDVNTQLDRLNWFTDETSYNFTEMVSNIAKFTATGKGLNESVTAMEGIATWAALSGQNAATASHAMYQLSQAMGAGVMRLEDYKSIQNASMDTEEFRQKCLDAGVALGTLKENGDGTYSSLVDGATGASFGISQFANNLTKEMWLTSDVMMKVFNDYSAAVEGIYNAAEEKGMLASEIIDEIYTTAEQKGISTDEAIKSLGYDFDSFALKAFEAAQKARTFNDAIDSVKDAVSTGWMKTFELIFGDAEKATVLWTDLANTLWDVFAAGGETRNAILETSLNFAKPWETIKEKIKTIQGIKSHVKGVVDIVGDAADKLKYFQDVVDKVWRGDFGNQGDTPDRRDLLTKAGYDPRVIQDLVNKGSQYKLTIEDIETSYKKFGLTLDEGAKKTDKAATAFDKLSDRQLKQAGLTEDEIDLYRALEKEADRLGITVSELADEMSTNDGRTLLIDSFRNLGSVVLDIGKAIKEAWTDIFNPPSIGELSVKLYGIIKQFSEFTEKFRLTDKETGKFNETGQKLVRTLKGLWAIVDIVTTLIGGPFKIAFRVAKEILGHFDLNILDITASIGDAIVAFHDWLFENEFINKVFDKIASVITGAISKVREWFAAFKESPMAIAFMDKLNVAISWLRDAFEQAKTKVSEWFAAFDASTAAKAVINGMAIAIGVIIKAFNYAVPKVKEWFKAFNENPKVAAVLNKIATYAKKAGTAVKNWVKSFADVPFISRTLETIKNAYSKIGEAVSNGTGKVKQWFNAFVKLPVVAKAIEAVSKALSKVKEWYEAFKETPAVQVWTDAINDLSTAINDLLNGDINCKEFGSKLVKGIGDALKSIPGIAVQIASDFIAGFQNGIGDKISGVVDRIVSFCLNLVSSFAEALGVASPSWKAYNIISDFFQGAINAINDKLGPVLEALRPVGEKIVEIFKSFFKFFTNENGDADWGKILGYGITIESLVLLNSFIKSFDKFTTVLDKFASPFAAFKDIATSVKKVIDQVALSLKNLTKAMSMDLKANAIMKLAIAIGILAASIWVLASIDDYGKLWNAVGVIAALAVIVGILAIAIDKISASSIAIEDGAVKMDGLKRGIIQIGITLLLLAAVVKLIGTMDVNEAKQGFIGLAGLVAALVVFMAAMGGVSRYSKDVSGFGKVMLQIAIALGILVVVMKMLAKMDPADIVVGLAVISAFALICIEFGIANKIAGGTDNGSSFKKMAIAIGILALVLKMIAKMDPADIVKGLAVMEAFVLIIIQMGIANRLAGGEVAKFGGTVIAVSFSMALLAGVTWLLSKLDEETIKKGVKAMQAFLLVIAEMILISKLAGKESAKIAANILSMFIAIGILVGICILLRDVEIADMMKGVAIVGALGLVMSAMIWATRGANDVKKSITAMAAAIAVMAIAVVALSFIADDGDKLAKSTAALGSLMLCFALIVKAASTVQDTKGALASLATVTGVIIVLTGVIYLLSQLDPNTVVPNAIALGALLTLMASALFIMAKAGKMSKTVSKQIWPLLGVVVALAGILTIMAALDVQASIPNAIAIGVLLNLMASALFIMAKAGKMSKTVSDQLKPLTLVVLGLAAILTIMAALDVQASIPNAIAIGVLLNLMASALFIMAKAGKMSKTVSDQLKPLTLVVAGLAVILGILGALDVQASIPTAIAIGVLLNCMATAMVIASLAGPNAAGAASAMAVMSIAVAAIGVVLGIMAAFNIAPSLETAVAMSTLLLAMSAACLIASLVPAPAAISGALGLAAFIGIMAVVIAAAGALMKIPGAAEFASGGAELLGIIGTAIGNFVGGIVAGIVGSTLSLIPKLGVALSAFAIGVQPFIALVGNIDSSVIAGAGYLTGAILALTAAGFISGIATLMTGGLGSLPALGTQLCLFGLGVKNFIASIEGLDSTAIDAVNSLTGIISALTVSNCVTALTEFFVGSADFASIGEKLKHFGEAVVDFSNTISGNIDTTAVQAAADAGAMLVALNESLPRSGGWVQDIIGEQDFGKFATACKAFAECILDVNATLSQEGFEVQSDKIAQLTEAGTKFNDLNNALPKTGGTLQEFLGEQDLAKFGKAVENFVNCLVKVNESLSQPGFVVQEHKLGQLSKAGTNFSNLVNSLPKSGGILQDFLGEEDLAKFGRAVSAFATCMVSVNNALNQEGFSVNLNGMEQLKQAGIKMNELQDTLPKSGGWLQDIAGESDIGDFGKKINAFATAILTFSNNSKDLDTTGIDLAISTAYRLKTFIGAIKDIDYSGVKDFTGVGTGGVGADGPLYKIAQAISAFSNEVSGIETEKISVAITAARLLRTFISTLPGLDSSGVANFNPKPIGTAMKSYSSSVSGINFSKVNTSISVGYKLKSFISSLSGLNTSGVSSFNSALNSLASANVSGVVSAFSAASTQMTSIGTGMMSSLSGGITAGSSTVVSGVNTVLRTAQRVIKSSTLFKAAGKVLANNLAAGIRSGSSSARSAGSSVASSGASGASSNKSGFTSAGYQAALGFGDGLANGEWYVKLKARGLAVAAENAAKEQLDINSPSKVFRAIGASVPEGFAMGIGMLSGEVKQSVVDMSNTAIDSTRSAMVTVLDALNSDIDAQPTIRPVIDLTDVQTGANAIHGMFDGVQTVGVRSNLNAINATMNAKLQNGTNEDIISAINKLGNGLENARGDTYNFGDFTYDDGSNVADAVGTLIRYAKIGRRV